MDLIKGKNYGLSEIFENAANENRKGIKIFHIWVNECEICGREIPVVDDEYSFEYITENESVYTIELLNAFKDFQEEYGIWQKKLEENVKDFTFIRYDKYDNTDVFYFYNRDYSNKELCTVCEHVFKFGGKK